MGLDSLHDCDNTWMILSLNKFILFSYAYYSLSLHINICIDSLLSLGLYSDFQ